MNEAKKKNRTIEYIALFYLVVWTISPPLQIDMLYRILALLCAVLLFAVNNFQIGGKEQWCCVYFVILVALSTYIQEGNASAVMSQIATYMLFAGYIFNCWYKDDWYAFKSIVPLTLLLLAIWNYKTTMAIAEDPNAARTIVRNDEAANDYLRQGVGGYALMYCQVIIVPAIASWIIRVFKNNKLFFACGIVWAISFYSFLMISGYTIALVSTIIGLVCLFFYNKKSIIPAVVISAIFVVLMVYLIGYNDAFRNSLLNIFDGTEVAQKINDIYESIITDKAADSIYARITRYQLSLNIILFKYPIIGSWFNGGAGGHSAILDAFALYGIFGGYIKSKMIYYVSLTWKKSFVDTNNKVLLKTINATFITITFVTILDSLPFQFVMMLTVILPIIMSCLKEWGKDNADNVDSEYDTLKPRKSLKYKI